MIRIKEGIRHVLKDIKNAFFQRLVCDETALRRSAVAVTVIYSLLLPWMLLFKFSRGYLILRTYHYLSSMSVTERFLLDLLPFRFTHDYINQIIVILLNCVIFAPYGVIFNTLFKKSIRRDLLICFLISLAVEIIQLFTCLGGFATIDLITNTASYFVGLAFYRLVLERLNIRWNVILYRAAILILTAFLLIAAVSTVGVIDTIWGVITRTL